MPFLYRLCVETIVIHRKFVFSGNVLMNYLDCASLDQFTTDKEHSER